MIVWGIVGNSHDASIAVFKDGKLIWAALAKDFSKIEHDPHLNPDLVNAAKEAGGWKLQVPDKTILKIWLNHLKNNTLLTWKKLKKLNQIKKWI